MQIINAMTLSAFYVILRQINLNVKEYVSIQNKLKKVKNCIEYTLEKQQKSEEEINNRIKELILGFQKGQKQAQYAYIEVKPSKALNLSSQNIKIMRQSQTKSKNLYISPYFYKICGEPFSYRLSRNHTLLININQCNVFEEALNKTTTDYSFLDDNSRSYFDEYYTLNIVKKLAFFGMLKYNLDSKVLQFQSNLLLCESTRKQVFEKLQQTFRVEKYSTILNVVSWCTVFGILFALTSHSLIRLLDTPKRFFKSLFNNNNEVIDQNIKTIGAQRLKCKCGKAMDLLPPCHHLTCCRQCYQLNKRCKICGTVSLQGQVIYI